MNALEIKNLTRSFPEFTLGPLDLALPQGCILGLIGANGAGKSTTIRLLLNQLKAGGGSIRLLGQPHTTFNREDVGVVLDSIGIPGCLNARQTDRVMAGIYRRWDSQLYRAYLARFSLPEGKAFQDYSKGMKMKLGIAVALSHGAKLLILDEATSGLDPVIRDEILDIFMEFTRNPEHSILISSHIVSDLEKVCDYIAFLHQGRLMLMEEKDVLREQYGILRCSVEEFQQLDPACVAGKKKNPYGMEVIVRRFAVSPSTVLQPVDLEQLFIFMTKEAD